MSGYLPAALGPTRNQTEGCRDCCDAGATPDVAGLRVSSAPVVDAATTATVQPVRPAVAAPALSVGHGCPPPPRQP